MLGGRNRAHAQRIRTGCSQHPEYKGQGVPNPTCDRCFHIHEGWEELVAEMNKLLKDD